MNPFVRAIKPPELNFFAAFFSFLRLNLRLVPVGSKH